MNRSIHTSPNTWRAASSLCDLHAQRSSPMVAPPPRANGVFQWSISTWWVEPQISPDASLNWHFPPSRSQTARRTSAGRYRDPRTGGGAGAFAVRGFATSPFRLAERSRMRSSPFSRISSTDAPGLEWESASRARSSFARNRFETV